MKRTLVLGVASAVSAALIAGCGSGASALHSVMGSAAQRFPFDGAAPRPLLLRSASYVTDRSTNTIAVFRHLANGDVKPAYAISGGNTDLNSPTADGFDGTGQLYVLNAASFCVFPAGAFGNASPTYVVSGGLTQLSNPQGLAVDASGTTYVTNLGSGQSYIAVYAPGSNGDRAPERTIYDAQNFFFTPAGIAVFGSTLYVADQGDSSINEYPTSSNGLVNPTAMITGLNNPKGVAVDSLGHIYVTDGDAIFVYAANANGNAKPIRTITGSNTLLNGPDGLEVSRREIEVANAGGASVTVYPQSGKGNIAPLRTIAGSHTGLVSPQGVSVH